jgi:hypothetical protein
VNEMERFNEELENLLARYREALPDPEPSADFMPRLWGRIEARRSLTVQLRRLTRVFVAGAAAFCLLMMGVSVLPRSNSIELKGSYIDVLADAQPPDSLASLGIVHVDSGEPNAK